MKAAIYARVSTGDQHNAIQIRDLTEYIERRGSELAAIYEDQMSGAKASRPGLDRLMADARVRRFDAVLVWKLDGFGRSLVHCVGGIQELASLGIRFIATSQGLDTDESNPASKLLLHILAAVAQFERELIRERVSAGMRAAQSRGTRSGKPIGRPRRVFDHQQVRRLRQDGLAIDAIARQMKLGVGTVLRGAAESASVIKCRCFSISDSFGPGLFGRAFFWAPSALRKASPRAALPGADLKHLRERVRALNNLQVLVASARDQLALQYDAFSALGVPVRKSRRKSMATPINLAYGPSSIGEIIFDEAPTEFVVAHTGEGFRLTLPAKLGIGPIEAPGVTPMVSNLHGLIYAVGSNRQRFELGEIRDDNFYVVSQSVNLTWSGPLSAMAYCESVRDGKDPSFYITINGELSFLRRAQFPDLQSPAQFPNQIL